MPERLDTGDYTAIEYAQWLREISWINRTFGEVRALRRSLMREVRAGGEQMVTALEIGAGSGTLMRKLQRWLGTRETFLVGTEIDDTAARAIYRASPRGDVVTLRCDGMLLPFADRSFDYVFCSLLLHHMNDDDAVRMLSEMRRVARKRIFVIDLNRSPIAFIFSRRRRECCFSPLRGKMAHCRFFEVLRPAK